MHTVPGFAWQAKCLVISYESLSDAKATVRLLLLKLWQAAVEVQFIIFTDFSCSMDSLGSTVYCPVSLYTNHRRFTALLWSIILTTSLWVIPKLNLKSQCIFLFFFLQFLLVLKKKEEKGTQHAVTMLPKQSTACFALNQKLIWGNNNRMCYF